jgi:NDP-sugar pyrophosphorylase family protein
MKYIDYGLSYFRSDVFAIYPEETEFDLSDLLSNLCDSQKLDGFEVNNRFYEIGSIQGIEDLSNYLKGAG